MYATPESYFTTQPALFTDVVLPEEDRWVVRLALIDEVLQCHELNNIPRFRVRLRDANDPETLKHFTETALKVLSEDMQYYRDMIKVSLNLLVALKNEVSTTFFATVEDIRKATRHVTLPPERSSLIIATVKEAMNGILREIENQIYTINSYHTHVQCHMTSLEKKVRNALTKMHEYASIRLVNQRRDEYVSLCCRHRVLINMVPLILLIHLNRKRLDDAHRELIKRNYSLEIQLMSSRKMIQAARNIALSSSGLLARTQVNLVMTTLRKAMEFTKKRALFDAEYNTGSAFYRLFHLFYVLLDI